MNKELIKEVAKRLGVTRQAAWAWMKLGLSETAKDYLLKHGAFIQSRGSYIIIMHSKEYIVQPSFWGELKGLKELRASVQQLKKKDVKPKS
jgi:hypothetical protein